MSRLLLYYDITLADLLLNKISASTFVRQQLDKS